MCTVEPIRDISIIHKIENVLKKKNIRDYILFILGINSGLRISDRLALNVNDVKNKNYIRLKEKKTGKNKIIPLNEKLKQELYLYTKNKNNNEPLFVTKQYNRLDRISAYRIIKQACKDNCSEINIGTHSLRKTFGYHHYKKFNDIVMLQKILNHSTPNVTLRYIGIEQDQINQSYLNFTL